MSVHSFCAHVLLMVCGVVGMCHWMLPNQLMFVVSGGCCCNPVCPYVISGIAFFVFLFVKCFGF